MNEAEDIKSLRADVLELSNNFNTLKEVLSTGKGLQRNDNQLSTDDLKAMLPQRIGAASLREIVELVEGEPVYHSFTPSEPAI